MEYNNNSCNLPLMNKTKYTVITTYWQLVFCFGISTPSSYGKMSTTRILPLSTIPPSSTVSFANISYNSEISCCTYKSSTMIISMRMPDKGILVFCTFLPQGINKSFRYENNTIVITKICTFTDYICYVICNLF